MVLAGIGGAQRLLCRRVLRHLTRIVAATREARPADGPPPDSPARAGPIFPHELVARQTPSDIAALLEVHDHLIGRFAEAGIDPPPLDAADVPAALQSLHARMERFVADPEHAIAHLLRPPSPLPPVGRPLRAADLEVASRGDRSAAASPTPWNLAGGVALLALASLWPV